MNQPTLGVAMNPQRSNLLSSDALESSDRPVQHTGINFDQVRLRLLRCTAQAMASGPGGLRFVAGTRPWLEGLAVA